MPPEALEADNILVDVDGPRLFDMSYLLAADAYVGDASSQVYEFLVRPRPVFILDPGGSLAEQGEVQLPFLTTGTRIVNASELGEKLASIESEVGKYRAKQELLIADTFALSDKPASSRAAAAIAEAIGAADA